MNRRFKILHAEHPLSDDGPQPEGKDELVEVTASRMLLVDDKLTFYSEGGLVLAKYDARRVRSVKIEHLSESDTPAPEKTKKHKKKAAKKK